MPLAPDRAFPNTHAKPLYRGPFRCHLCRERRWFRFDGQGVRCWVCEVCDAVLLTSQGQLWMAWRRDDG